MSAPPYATILVCSGKAGFEEKGQENHVDPHAWFVDVLARIAEGSNSRLDELLPWHGRAV
ncbi:hypothetical protein CA233_15835 [Sphingomonas sp. ABOLD]|nr:hypothetical protein CA233_15835 [Sphingomonas sp. ABOLD]